MASKRQIVATAPDGTEIATTGLGAKRAVGAIRITGRSGQAIWGDGSSWLVTVHKSLENAISGPNQTPMWNNLTRWAVAVDENDQPVGGWVPASK